MAKVFISCSNQASALEYKKYIESYGHLVVSSWHDKPPKRTSELSVCELTDLTHLSFSEIAQADCLLLLDDPDMVPGGKFVDVGFALASGLTVFLVGRRENRKMYHKNIRVCLTGSLLVKELDNVLASVSGY